MTWLSEIAPDIHARVAEAEAHQASCTADPCARCGRLPKIPAPEPQAVDSWTRHARATVPAAYAATTFDQEWLAALVGPETLTRARNALHGARAVFLGLPGSGKTSLAVAMFFARLEADRPPAVLAPAARHMFASAHALAKARAMHPLGDGEAPLVAAALRAPLLVLDELGGEDQRHGTAVAEVIYERHAAGLPTWVTTGAEPKEIAQRYGGGIARRIFEHAAVFRLARR